MVYLYDAIYETIEEMDINSIICFLDISKDKMDYLKSSKMAFKNRWYILDDNINIEYLSSLSNKHKYRDELWRPIKGTNHKYEISNFGRVKEITNEYPKGIVLSTFKLSHKNLHNYNFKRENINKIKRRIKLFIDDTEKTLDISELVACHFLGEAYKDDFNIKDYNVIHKNNLNYDDFFQNLSLKRKSKNNIKLENN